MRGLAAGACALLLLIALPSSSAVAAESASAVEGAVSPLPASDYTVSNVCAPPAPGYASCLALTLVARTAAARAHTHPLGISQSRPIVAAKASEGAFGLRPQDLHSIYALPTSSAVPQTIALVDAYNDPTAEADLKAYDKEFGLPECTVANKCFKQVNQQGESGKPPFPASSNAKAKEEAACNAGSRAACRAVEEADGWAQEISLDIETAQAVCENCKVILVEANSAAFADLEAAESTATKLGATEISNSFGGPEAGGTVAEDNASSFNHPGTVITAAAGDAGYLDWGSSESSQRGFADYPASSPHVIAVGGTRLLGPLGPGGTWAGERVWNGDGAGGGGCSRVFTAPIWQQSTSGWPSVGCGEHRAVADVSADGDPYTGVAVYYSGFRCEYEEGATVHLTHWCTIGGTSLASPLIASVFALAGGANGVAYPAQSVYENEGEVPTSLHDVTSGSNGECRTAFNEEGLSGCTLLQEAAGCAQQAICLAGEGYDGPSGVGTPNGIVAFQPVSEEVRRANEERRRAEVKLREERHGEELKGAREREQEEATRAQGAGGTSSGAGTGAGQKGEAHPGTATPPSTASLVPTIKLSAFALTPSALLALSRARPRVASVSFAFTISAAAHMRAVLAKLVRIGARTRWSTVPGALLFTAVRGRNHRSLSNRKALGRGRYRLTLTPVHGIARSITFQIR